MKLFIKQEINLNEFIEREDKIKENFRFSVLDIYKSTTEDKVITEREQRWKDILMTRKFGYNEN